MIDLTTWLGDTETTPEQYTHLVNAAEMVDDLYPGPDLVGENIDALNGAMTVILEDDTLEDLAHAYSKAKRRADEALRKLYGGIIGTRLTNLTATEQQLADRAGVTRITARKALGK